MEKEEYKSRLKPQWLPQMNAPYDYVVKHLGDNGVPYAEVKTHPDLIKPIQNFVSSDSVDYFSDKNNNKEEISPIYIDSENNIIDGHNRFAAHIQGDNANNPMSCIKVMSDYKDAARILNKIQDKYETEQNGNTEDNKTLAIDDIQANNKKLNPQTVIGFRNEPVKEKSNTGNFFSLHSNEEYNIKYQIDFDNLCEIPKKEIMGHGDPVLVLATKWFPDINLEEKAQKFNLDLSTFVNRLVAKKAKKEGYDGIRYGDSFIQAIESDEITKEKGL